MDGIEMAGVTVLRVGLVLVSLEVGSAMSEIFDPLSRPVMAAGRFILWLVWEVVVLWVPWYVGWPVWRVVTLGRFPETAAGDQEEASTLETMLVWGLGFLILCGVAWLVAKPFSSA